MILGQSRQKVNEIPFLIAGCDGMSLSSQATRKAEIGRITTPVSLCKQVPEIPSQWKKSWV
jgi:hypothetical protein